jgi:hypothetical protein
MEYRFVATLLDSAGFRGANNFEAATFVWIPQNEIECSMRSVFPQAGISFYHITEDQWLRRGSPYGLRRSYPEQFTISHNMTG